VTCVVLAWSEGGPAPGWRAIRSALGPEQRPVSTLQTPGHLLYKVIVSQFRHVNWRSHLSCRCCSCVKFRPVASMRTSDLMAAWLGLDHNLFVRLCSSSLFLSYMLQKAG
jgi:hypothetical protein